MVLGKPGQVPLPGAGPQVQHQRRDRRRAGLCDLLHRPGERRRGVGEIRQDRRHENPGGDPALAQRRARLQPPPGMWGPGLDEPPQLVVDEADGQRDADLRHLRGSGKQIEIAHDERALREHREGVAGVAQGGEDPRHEPVTTFGPLVGIDVRAHRHVFAAPAGRGELRAQPLGDVDLDDDLGVEVAPGVEIEVGMGAPGEAVPAGVGTATVGVHRPAERHSRRRRNPVEHGPGVDLVEGQTGEPRGVERTGDGAPGEQRRRTRAGRDGLLGGGEPEVVPTHALWEHVFDRLSSPSEVPPASRPQPARLPACDGR